VLLYRVNIPRLFHPQTVIFPEYFPQPIAVWNDSRQSNPGYHSINHSKNTTRCHLLTRPYLTSPEHQIFSDLRTCNLQDGDKHISQGLVMSEKSFIGCKKSPDPPCLFP
jgi:hypothetical protein